MFRNFILTIIVLSLTQILPAQIGYHHNVVPSIAPDSVDLAYYGKKRFGQSSASIMGVNLGIWSFNRFVMKEDFAYINKHTIRENFKHGFVLAAVVGEENHKCYCNEGQKNTRTGKNPGQVIQHSGRKGIRVYTEPFQIRF